MEDIQEEFVYEVATDHVILAKIVDPVVFVDDSKFVNVALPSDVSDCLLEKEIVDSSIEVATLYENDDVAAIETTEEDESEDVDALQKELKSIYIFLTKCASKVDGKKNHELKTCTMF